LANEPCKPHEYALTGPQVEPKAGYWMFCSKLHIPTIEELTKVTDDEGNPDYFPPYPDPCSAKGKEQIEEEIEELVALSKRRDDPCSLAGAADEAKDLGLRQPISKLLDLTPVALGAVVVNRLAGEQIIRTGRGMARAVESETPGLFHRHALNYLIRTRHWSPPRQALIWAALDVTIAGALQAAWYYKWVSPRPLVSRRERPSNRRREMASICRYFSIIPMNSIRRLIYVPTAGSRGPCRGRRVIRLIRRGTARIRARHRNSCRTSSEGSSRN
jgi:hypothetical protein